MCFHIYSVSVYSYSSPLFHITSDDMVSQGASILGVWPQQKSNQAALYSPAFSALSIPQTPSHTLSCMFALLSSYPSCYRCSTSTLNTLDHCLNTLSWPVSSHAFFLSSSEFLSTFQYAILILSSDKFVNGHDILPLMCCSSRGLLFKFVSNLFSLLFSTLLLFHIFCVMGGTLPDGPVVLHY